MTALCIIEVCSDTAPGCYTGNVAVDDGCRPWSNRTRASKPPCRNKRDHRQGVYFSLGCCAKPFQEIVHYL